MALLWGVRQCVPFIGTRKRISVTGFSRSAASWGGLFWGSRSLHRSLPRRFHPEICCGKFLRYTIRRSGWYVHKRCTTSHPYGSGHNYLKDRDTSSVDRQRSYHRPSNIICHSSHIPPTWKCVLVTVKSSELLPVVTAEGVAGVALVGAEPQSITLTLWLQVEAAVLGVHFLSCPVLQLYHQFIVALFPQIVDVFQSKPVFAIYVSKASLGDKHHSILHCHEVSHEDKCHCLLWTL